MRDKKGISTNLGAIILVVEVIFFALAIYYVSQQIKKDVGFSAESAKQIKTQNNINNNLNR